MNNNNGTAICRPIVVICHRKAPLPQRQTTKAPHKLEPKGRWPAHCAGQAGALPSVPAEPEARGNTQL